MEKRAVAKLFSPVSALAEVRTGSVSASARMRHTIRFFTVIFPFLVSFFHCVYTTDYFTIFIPAAQSFSAFFMILHLFSFRFSFLPRRVRLFPEIDGGSNLCYNKASAF